LIDPSWLLNADEYGRRLLDNVNDPVAKELTFLFGEENLGKNKLIIPILLDGATMPPSHALPASFAQLSRLKPFKIAYGEDIHLTNEINFLSDKVAKYLEVDGLSTVANRKDIFPFRIESLEINRFRGLERINLDFTPASTLPGDWTCIAGINGAGKSSILQAIALVLLGPKHAMELGGNKLAGMKQRTNSNETIQTRIRASVSLYGATEVREISIGPKGPLLENHNLSRDLGGILVAGYGASRNLSDTPDRYESLSTSVQSVISLFEPMAQLREANEIFKSHSDKAAITLKARSLFAMLVESVFVDGLAVKINKAGHELTFSTESSTSIALDLADGYRSSIAWMSDLCFRWVRSNPDTKISLEQVQGIVLIDELDLHLHASLQRVIVPRLRQAMPNIQWIVSSHAPLILASFDRREMIALDNETETGYRTLNDQIYGYTTDQIYDYVLSTPPSSEVSEQTLDSIANLPSADRLSELEKSLGSKLGDEPRADRMERIRNRIKNYKK